MSDLVASDAAKEALPFTRAGAHEAVAFLIDDPLPHEAAGAERASDELVPNRCLYKDFANCICRMASGPISAAVQYQPLGEARRRRSWPRGRIDRDRRNLNVINSLQVEAEAGLRCRRTNPLPGGASQPLATRGRSTVRRLHGHGWAERAGGLREGKAACTNRLGQRDCRRRRVSRRPTRLVEAAIGRSPGRITTARIAAGCAFAPAGRGRISVLTMVCALRKRELD